MRARPAKKRREIVDIKNQGDSLAYNAEKALNDAGESIAAEDRSSVESAISSLKDTLKEDDPEAIKRAIQNLEQASHKISEAMYKKAQEQQAQETPESDQGASADDDDVIDADFEVKE